MVIRRSVSFREDQYDYLKEVRYQLLRGGQDNATLTDALHIMVDEYIKNHPLRKETK